MASSTVATPKYSAPEFSAVLAHCHGAVAVAVGLHHGHEPGTRIQALLHGRGVVTDGVQVDLHPGPAPIHLGNAGELVRVEARGTGGLGALLGEAQHVAGRR